MEMRAYLAGPISGVPDFETRFKKAKHYVLGWKPGWEVINPVDVPAMEHLGSCPPGRPGGQSDTHTEACFLRSDLQQLLRCGHIVMLSGWTMSQGARLEFDIARQIGMKIWEMDGLPYNRMIDMDGRANYATGSGYVT